MLKLSKDVAMGSPWTKTVEVLRGKCPGTRFIADIRSFDEKELEEALLVGLSPDATGVICGGGSARA